MSNELTCGTGVAGYRPVQQPARALECPDAALTRALRSFVQGKLGSHAEGDDVVQETYLRLFSYQAVERVGDVKALCFAIARNLVLDYHRAARRAAQVELDETMVCPLPMADRIVGYRRAVELMAQALELMPPLRREIFLRKRLDGCSTAEIARALDMRASAVEKHVVRAFHDLRAHMTKRGFTMEAGA